MLNVIKLQMKIDKANIKMDSKMKGQDENFEM